MVGIWRVVAEAMVLGVVIWGMQFEQSIEGFYGPCLWGFIWGQYWGGAHRGFAF